MPKHILIIDDEELVAKSLSILLKSSGYKTSVARSGEQALDMVKAENFDLIVSDLRMPGLDGVETIKRIRDILKAAGKNSIPEVFITGYADMEKYQEAMDLKVADYLYKPFDSDELLRVVRETIG